MPGMPIGDFLLPKITPFLTGNDPETVWKFLGRKFSGKRPRTQPNDNIILTNIDEAFRRKIQLGRCCQIGCQKYTVLYAKVRISIYICHLEKGDMAVRDGGA